ncbi:Ig-like domain-containing protein [Lactococcus garvieae]|uniref:Ig-like domain-containing protein n=1 Tax=Lactococcus garvieae TaxID=1363 RepID=UPI001F60B994|nr:Ig-like domain-containing protein [Lactococcus garvieae]MCI3861376.1 Ig-like domain-containing protein [Lactococcus garvieae]
MTHSHASTTSKQSPTGVYRLYNKKSMQHLYTSDVNEYKQLPEISHDWKREGINFKEYKNSDTTTVPIYRIYNPKSGEHINTSDKNEVHVLATSGWKNEGTAFYAPKSGGKAIYRLFNPKAGLGAHFVTGDVNEKNILTHAPKDWRYEGIAWRAVDEKAVTVSDKTSINTQNVTLSKGDKWNPKMGFKSATDKTGHLVTFDKITVGGDYVNTSKVGIYKVSYKYGEKVSLSKVTVVDRKEKPKAPSVTNIIGNSHVGYTIRGTAEANSTIKVKDVSGHVLNHSTTDASGHYIVNNITKTVGAGTKLLITASNAGGESTSATTRTPLDPSAPTTPTVEITGDITKGFSVSGVTSAGSRVEIKKENTLLGTASADASGHYIIQLSGSIGYKAEVLITASNEWGSASRESRTPINPLYLPVLHNDTNTVDFAHHTWSVIKDDGNGNYMIAMNDETCGYFNYHVGDEKTYFSDSDVSINGTATDGYTTSAVKIAVDAWYNKNIAGTDYEESVKPVILKNPTLGDMITAGIFNSYDQNGDSTKWASLINSPNAYPTTVDTHGKKQGFQLGVSDVVDENGQLTPNTSSYVDAVLENTGRSSIWLRSPGTKCNKAAFLIQGAGGDYMTDRTVTDPSTASASLIVHISEQ